MSYSDFLRTKLANAPKIVDARMHLGDASSYTSRVKQGAAYIIRRTDHVINLQNDPMYPLHLNSKKATSYPGTGYGGAVQDASMYTQSLGARSIGQDVFPSVKFVQTTTCGTTPAPSLVKNSNGNVDGSKIGLNQGYQDTCAIFNPESKPQFVDTNPNLKHLGVKSRESWNGALGTNYGSQTALPVGCTTTMTQANFGPKDVTSPQYSPPPKKTDFVTGVMGLQVSRNGAFGRAPKVGSVIARSKYVESHHGNTQLDHVVYPRKFKPTTGAPAQLKINGPQHYPVA